MFYRDGKAIYAIPTLNTSQRHATIHHKYLPCRKGRCARSQIDSYSSNVVRLTDASRRRSLNNTVEQILVLPNHTSELGLHQPRRDGIYLNILARQFHRPSSRRRFPEQVQESPQRKESPGRTGCGPEDAAEMRQAVRRALMRRRCNSPPVLRWYRNWDRRLRSSGGSY